MGELKFIGKRVVYLAVMLFGVATLVFILTKMIPGDPVVANLSQRALNDPEIVAAYRAKHGLDRPLIVQYIYYIRDLLHFDLGTSIRTSRPVLDDLARCYPATLELALFSIVIASVFGILFGIISAIRRNSILDQIVRAISVTGVSIPAFWFALLMLYFFYYKLKIFPGPGRLSNSFSAPASVTGMYVIDSLIEGNLPKAMDALSHLVLPGIEDCQILCGTGDPEQAAQFYQEKGVQTVVIKEGAKGAFVKDRETSFRVPGFPVEKVIDTVGAGDGFAVGVISGLLEGKAVEESVRRGNAIGALQVMNISDNEGLPDREELRLFMEKK